MEISSISGVPAHPLFVHIPVVGIPLVALLFLAYVIIGGLGMRHLVMQMGLEALPAFLAVLALVRLPELDAAARRHHLSFFGGAALLFITLVLLRTRTEIRARRLRAIEQMQAQQAAPRPMEAHKA